MQFVKSRPALVGSINQEEEEMNLKTITALALLAATPALAAGSICIVCPPGYDCSGAKPVAKTGDARLATIGDIPTTAAQVGAVPTTRTIAGLALSEDITMEQLRDVLDYCPQPVAGTPGYGTIESRCSDVPGTPGVVGNPSETYGQNCWCRYKEDIKKVFSGETCNIRYSAWVRDSINSTTCSEYCVASCKSNNNSVWHAASVWL